MGVMYYTTVFTSLLLYLLIGCCLLHFYILHQICKSGNANIHITQKYKGFIPLVNLVLFLYLVLFLVFLCIPLSLPEFLICFFLLQAPILLSVLRVFFFNCYIFIRCFEIHLPVLTFRNQVFIVGLQDQVFVLLSS